MYMVTRDIRFVKKKGDVNKSADRIKQYMTKGSTGNNILQNPKILPER